MILMMLGLVTGTLGWVPEGKCLDMDAPGCMEEEEV